MDVILHLKVDGKHTDLKFEKGGRIFDDVFKLEQHEKIHVFNALFRYVELFDSVLSLTTKYNDDSQLGMGQVGWHPGTEKPKAQNDRGEICSVFIITEDGDFGERLYYDENDIDMTNIRWWIYPPETK